MSAITFDVLMDGALRLPVEERSRMASRLIDSLDCDADGLPTAWTGELERRILEAESGQTPRIPHDEVMAGVRELLAHNRS